LELLLKTKDLKGERTEVIIGDENVIREYVTITGHYGRKG